MGSVKVDIHKSEYQWHVVNFSDTKIIKGLLKFRNEYDKLKNIENSQDDPRVVDFNKEVICIYISLDELIRKCNFNNKQLLVLHYYQEGYTENDISIVLKDSQQNIHKILNTCIKKIKNKASENWLYDFIFWNKQRTNETWLKCNKCLSYKPQNHFYFDKTKGDFKTKCKDC